MAEKPNETEWEEAGEAFYEEVDVNSSTESSVVVVSNLFLPSSVVADSGTPSAKLTTESQHLASDAGSADLSNRSKSVPNASDVTDASLEPSGASVGGSASRPAGPIKGVGVSQFPASSLSSSNASPARQAVTEAAAAAVRRVRAEVAVTVDRGRKARLLNEAAEIQELAGDEPSAARDYLSAYNADTNFREPLEGLVRLLERRRSLSNLGKLIEALVAAAATPDERARALTERATFIEDVQKDLEGARGAAREATETGAVASNLGAAWLTLELVAAKLGDATLREEALAGRADLTSHATWRALLLIDVARLAAASGDVDRALAIVIKARDENDLATWSAHVEIERLVRLEFGFASTSDTRAQARILAESFDRRAELIHEACTDAAGGDSLGVPMRERSLESAVDVLLRASEAWHRSGEVDRAERSLARGFEFLVDSRRGDLARAGTGNATTASTETQEGAYEESRTLERMVLNAQLRLADSAGNTARAAEIAERRLVGETDGGVRASLSLRIAEQAARQGDAEGAMAALSHATTQAPFSAPARALKLDTLGRGSNARLFAEELEDLSRLYASNESRGRAMILAAYVWAEGAGDADRARKALAQATACGVDLELGARFARSLASLCADTEWFETATVNLLLTEPLDELPWLWVELARLRIAAGDERGAADASRNLRGLPNGAWLGLLLDGLAGGIWHAPRAPDDIADTCDVQQRAREAVEELLKGVTDPVARTRLTVICAMRADAADDSEAVLKHLRALSAEDPSDPLVAAYLSDKLRESGDHVGIARTSKALADAHAHDRPLRCARLLEAGFELWRNGDRANAIAWFESASSADAEASNSVLAWASRGIDIDSLKGRRVALERGGGDGSVALERFALEALMGDSDEAAATALARLDIVSNETLRLAGALARLVWPQSALEPDALRGALDTLALVSSAASCAAAAESLRIARDAPSAEGPEDLIEAAKKWHDLGGGAAAAIEWLAATMASGDTAREVPARMALAEFLPDEASEAMRASATLLDALKRGFVHLPLLAGSSQASRLANLELAPPGSQPHRRAAALCELDGALGEQGEVDGLALAAWSVLATGDAARAREMFRTVIGARPFDIQAWEGVRAASEVLEDTESAAAACEHLGARLTNQSRAATFWERAGVMWSALGTEFDRRAEDALEASFACDPTRAVAFDRLFRRVRERKDADRLLSLIDKRLEVTNDPQEIAKLYWEMARVLREKGNPEGALEALEHVTLFDENHVGALALTGEIFIRQGMFTEAASKLGRLATIDAASPKNRITAGVAAVDLYENKLGRHDLALAVLLKLHSAGLTTLPVRERLARAAARTGSWSEATRILEQLMHERPEREGRMEAARLALAIHRDRLNSPGGALVAASLLLDEAPGDGEALDVVVLLDPTVPQRRSFLEHGRDALLFALHESPADVEVQRRLARVSRALGDASLEQSALSCAVALGDGDRSSETRVSMLGSRKPRVPHIALTEGMIRQILAPGDDGPIAELFAVLGPTLTEALGPQLSSLGVHAKKDRVDPRAGLAVRNEIATWAGAFGIAEFDLCVGGVDPTAVTGVPFETPVVVIGSDVNAPLSPVTRSRVARELLGIVRGSSIARWRDDSTLAAIVVAACNIAKVPIAHPPFAVLAEVERLMSKAISRKTKAAIVPLCMAIVQSNQDARLWAARARASQGRVAVLASGDVSVVLADLFGAPFDQVAGVIRDDLRAHELLRFVLSRPYFDLRRAIGLEG